MARFFILILCVCLISPATARTLYRSGQTSAMAASCPTGSEEAEAIHQLARQYLKAQKGKPHDKFQAERLFEEALAMGNAKSALQLGDLYFNNPWYRESIRYRYMMAMYNQAAEMGCPDAYLILAKHHEEGWGARKDKKKAMELLELSAEKGSPKGMEFWGAYLIDEKKEVEPGRQWLERALAAGNGDAGVELASYYRRQKNAEGLIQSLRSGAQQGSKACLYELRSIYSRGESGQDKNEKHAACYDKLYDAIDDFDIPRPIANFDKICPLLPVKPYKWY